MEGCVASMYYPAHHSIMFLWTMVFYPAWLHLQQRSSRTQGTRGRRKTPLKGKEPSLGICLGLKRFSLYQQLRHHAVLTSSYRDQNRGSTDCLFKRDPSDWAKYVPYLERFKGAKGDPQTLKAIIYATRPHPQTTNPVTTPGWTGGRYRCTPLP